MAVAYYDWAPIRYEHPHSVLNIGVLAVRGIYNCVVKSSTQKMEELRTQADDEWEGTL